MCSLFFVQRQITFKGSFIEHGMQGRIIQCDSMVVGGTVLESYILNAVTVCLSLEYDLFKMAFSTPSFIPTT